VSLGVHTALILGSVYAIRSAGRSATSVVMDTTVVFLESPQLVPQQLSVPLDVPLKGFQTLAVLPVIPTSIPPVDLQQHFDPRDYSGGGVEGGVADGAAPAENRVYAAATVEEAPALLSPPPNYPEPLRRAGIEGHVLLQAVVDTAGRLEPSSVRFSRAPAPALTCPPSVGRSPPGSGRRGCRGAPCGCSSTCHSIFPCRHPGVERRRYLLSQEASHDS